MGFGQAVGVVFEVWPDRVVIVTAIRIDLGRKP